MDEKIRIDVCKSPAKGHYTLYINGIRVYGSEPLFEPPVMSFMVEKELISGALEGLSSYDIKKLKNGNINNN